MKYMLLAYSDENAWTEDERMQCMAESTDLCHELQAKGQYVDASPLHPMSTATSLRIRNERREITDGPFAETREQLGGYFLIDVKNLDEAMAFAARLPSARKGTIEIRPIFELANLPVPAKQK